MDEKPNSFSYPFTVFVAILILSIALFYLVFSFESKEYSKNSDDVYYVFFNNQGLQNDEVYLCGAVFPIERKIENSIGVELAVLEELVKGPSEEELREGYSSLFSSETSDIIKSLKVAGNIAYVDLFDFREKIPGANSSCGGESFIQSVNATLNQFPSIDEVRFAIDGSPEEFYEWMQIGCGEGAYWCNSEPFR